ncbi:MAG: acyl-CoA thioesterase [Butyrivibrio sp.]
MTYIYSKRVAYYETDMMGVVHHSNYIRWFEEARIEFLRSADLSYRVMEDENIQIPVVSVSCRYKTPAVFDDEVEIRTSFKKYNGILAEIQYEVVRKCDGTVLVTGESSHCFVDKETFKPLNIKRTRPDMHEKFIKAMENTEE